MRLVATTAVVMAMVAALVIGVAGCGGDNLALCDGCGTPTPTLTATPIGTATFTPGGGVATPTPTPVATTAP